MNMLDEKRKKRRDKNKYWGGNYFMNKHKEDYVRR